MSNTKIYAILWFAQYLKPYRWIAVAGMVFLTVSVVFSLIPPLLIKDIVDTAIPDKDQQLLYSLFGWLCATLVVTALFQALEEYFTATLGLKVVKNIRTSLYEHIQKLPSQFFLETKTGEITTRFTTDMFNIQRTISKTVPGLFTNAVMLLVAIGLMLNLNVALTLAAIATIPVYLTVLFFIVKTNNLLSKKFFKISDQLSGNLTDNFSFEGQLHSRVNGHQERNRKVFGVLATAIRSVRLRMGLLTRGNETLFHLLSMLGIAIVYLVGGNLVFDDSVSLGTIIAFSVFVTRLYQPLSFFSTSAIELSSALVSAERLKGYIDLKQDHIYFNDKPPVELLTEGTAIEFKDVTFSYTSSEDTSPILERFSCVVQSGSATGIVGENGSGKSTMALLSAGIYTPLSGEILIYGRSVKDIAHQQFSQLITIVFSNSYFSNGTIRENLQNGGIEITDESLQNALSLAECNTFIADLPDGLDTKVGQRGYRLSSGQRQRLALARVFLSHTPIVICDEVTSNLSESAEQRVLNNMLKHFKERTLVMISHNPDVIAKMDHVIKLAKHQACLKAVSS